MATAAAPVDRGESRLRFVPTPAQARVIAELLDVAPPEHYGSKWGQIS